MNQLDRGILCKDKTNLETNLEKRLERKNYEDQPKPIFQRSNIVYEMAEPEKGILIIDLTPYLRDTEFEAVFCVGLRESAAKNFFL